MNNTTHHQRVVSGQPLRPPSAATWNALLDTLNPSSGAGLSGRPTTSIEIDVYNDTGSDLPAFGIVEVGVPVLVVDSIEAAFAFGHVMSGTAPTASTTRIAVTQEPIADGAVGRALILGITACKFDVQDAGDGYASPTTSTDEFETGTSGPVIILSKESGTGTGKWGTALLTGATVSGGGSSGSAFEYEGYALTADWSHSGTVDTWEEVTGFDVASGGTSTYIEFPSTGVWRVDVHLTGFTQFAGSVILSAPFYARIVPVSTVSDLIAPDAPDVGSLVVAPVATGFYSDCHFSGLFDVSTANTKGLALECAFASPMSGTATGYIYRRGYVTGVKPSVVSCVTLSKVGG